MIKKPFKKNKDDPQPGVTFSFERYQMTLKLIRQDWFEDDGIWAKTVEEIRKALGAIIKSETRIVVEESYNEWGQYNGQRKKLEEVIKNDPKFTGKHCGYCCVYGNGACGRLNDPDASIKNYMVINGKITSSFYNLEAVDESYRNHVIGHPDKHLQIISWNGVILKEHKPKLIETEKLKSSFGDSFAKELGEYIASVNDVISDNPFSDIVTLPNGRTEVRNREQPKNFSAAVTNNGGPGGSGIINVIGNYETTTETRERLGIATECAKEKQRREKADIIAGLLINSRNVINDTTVECGYTAHSYVTNHSGIDCLDVRISKDDHSLKISMPYLNGRDQTEFLRNEIAKCIYKIELGLERDGQVDSNEYKERYGVCNTLDEFIDRVLED